MITEKPYYIETRDNGAMAYHCRHDDKLCSKQPCGGDCDRKKYGDYWDLAKKIQSEVAGGPAWKRGLSVPVLDKDPVGEWPGMDLSILRDLLREKE